MRRLRNLLRMTYDRAYWEQLWAKTLREHQEKVAHRPPNAHLIAEVASLRAGRALDAGCGHGTETLWLAAHGWEVTAVDYSASALAQARSTAQALGPDLADRITWVEADLALWTPPRNHFDLVVSLYVHIAGSVDEMVRRMAVPLRPAVRCSWSAIVRFLGRRKCSSPTMTPAPHAYSVA
jgi:2-polyprenyl-3-methyl-5-hydroxy-6-metoxy-1,4-benzoquinol methylase